MTDRNAADRDARAISRGSGTTASGLPPVFLERSSYQRRRLNDAARLFPILGILVFFLPLLWAEGSTSLSAALRYVFVAWALLIAAVVGFGRLARDADDGDDRIPVDSSNPAAQDNGREPLPKQEMPSP